MITIDGFTVDAALTESHDFESEVTTHAVEEGPNVVDHVRPLPVQVSISGLVSDTPVGTVADARNASPDLPSTAALALLESLRDSPRLIEIQTSLKLYSDMVLQSLRIPRDRQTGEALRFDAVFKQVRLVTNNRTTVAVSVPRAGKKQNFGAKVATPTNDPVPSEPQGLGDQLQTLIDRHTAQVGGSGRSF